MSSINISGIPKGLDRRTVSLRIRRDIERVAQVRNVWIQSDQGYGSVSLYDETSAEFVLKLNGKIIINGKTLSLTKLRKRQRVRQTPRPTTLTRRQQVDDDAFVFSGYDSYSSYRKHQPTNDTLFQDINQMPTKKKIKRKPWKNDVILSHFASPKSRVKRNKRRQTKKKKGSRWNSQQLTPQTNVRRRGRNVVHHTLESSDEVSTCRNEQAKCLGHPQSTPTYNKEHKEIASLTQVSFRQTQMPCTANVNVYDTSNRLFSIAVDNNNVFQSIKACLKDNHLLPPDNMMVIIYNGKVISEDWQPQMENEDNIHVFVKGKGGMQREDSQDNEDSSDEERQNTATYREGTESIPWKKEEGDRSRETTNRHHHRTLASTSDGYQKHIKDLPVSDDTATYLSSATMDYDKLSTMLLNKMREPRIFHEGYNPVTSLLEEISKGREDAVDISGALIEDQAGAFPKDEHHKTDMQVTDTAQFASTFSQDAEAFQARLVKDLELHDYFPGQLTFTDVMALRHKEKEEADRLADIPRLILTKLLMLDYKSRENDLNEYFRLCSERKTRNVVSRSSSSGELNKNADSFADLFNDGDMPDSSHSDKWRCDSLSYKISSWVEKWNIDGIHPIDVFLSIFVCLDPTMKQKICLKMFSCHLAIPFIFPVQTDNHHSKRLMLSMWPLRPITVYDGNTEISVVKCKQNIVSFIRLGRPDISKSKIANTLLYNYSDSIHDTFFNWDCKLGSSDKKASLGLVEASWFLPSPKQDNIFKSVTLFLNLRGDGFCNSEQVDYLKRVSQVMVVVIDTETIIHQQTRMDYLKAPQKNVLFLITGKLPKDMSIKRWTETYMQSRPDGFHAEFIPHTKHGRPTSMSEIQYQLVTTIRKRLDGTQSLGNVLDLCAHAQQMGIAIDEDIPTCKLGIILANLIFHEVEESNLVDIKNKFTPLQKEFWREYTHAMKNLNKPDQNITAKDMFKQAMTSQRKQQWNVFRAHSNALMGGIINIIMDMKGDVLVHFLDLLKFHLDQKLLTEIRCYQDRLDNAYNEFEESDDESDQAKKDVDKAEEELNEASFGIEHIFREMGQIYESYWNSLQSNSLTNLPHAMASLMREGYPLELMDGDVENIPLLWIEHIFKELKSMVNDERVLTLSILGLQSSGKSTLLNAMFGLTFPVSAGRCTRGIYLQLLPVDSNEFEFKYILVVDTEGLRAPELGSQKYQRDNQLGTLVIGMSDITIINIKGENTSELKEILSICASAFLKLKMTDESVKLRQSCVFVHQNVTAVNAENSLMQARKTLTKTLNEITKVAARAEKKSDIKAFDDVITFDSDTQVFYFSDFWKGNPPMAPTNPQYSTDVQRLKSFIFDKLAKRKKSYLTISDTFVHIKDLWSAILTNDIVFNFTNSLELREYGKLEKKYQDIIWELERYKKELEAKMFYDDKISKTDSRLEREYDKKVTDLRNILEKYLENIEKQHAIFRWKDAKLNSWEMFVSRLRKQILDTYSRGKDEYEISVALATLIKDVYRKATDLAKEMKENQRGETDKLFDEHWDKWIPKEEPVNVKDFMISILHKTFPKQSVDGELQKHLPNTETGTSLNTVYCFGEDNMQQNTSVGMDFTEGIRTSFAKNAKLWLKRREVYCIDNEIFSELDSKLKGMSCVNWKFNEKLMTECPSDIVKHVDELNRKTQNRFNLSQSIKLELVVHWFKQSLPLFERCYSEYRTKHCMEVKLQQYKHRVSQYFQDILNNVPHTVIVSNMFCDIIETQVEHKVRAELPDLIFQHTVVKFGKSKQILMKYVLKDLAQQEEFSSFIAYIKDPYTYTLNWLQTDIDGECFHGEVYVRNACLILGKIFTDMFDVMDKYCPSSSLEEWVSDFQREIKSTLFVQTESLIAVGFLPITNLNDFIKVTKDKLKQVRESLEKQFLKETKNTIEWYGKSPYDMSMEKLWGCQATCPFCNEPCKWNSHHSGPHSCIQHRPQGIAGHKTTITSKLWAESCSDVVSTTTYTYKCFPHSDNKCDEGHWLTYLHFYRNYKHFFPDWHIIPCSDGSGSTYWAWVLKTFNKDLIKYYGARNSDIPSIWKSITKQKAIESLQK